MQFWNTIKNYWLFDVSCTYIPGIKVLWPGWINFVPSTKLDLCQMCTHTRKLSKRSSDITTILRSWNPASSAELFRTDGLWGWIISFSTLWRKWSPKLYCSGELEPLNWKTTGGSTTLRRKVGLCVSLDFVMLETPGNIWLNVHFTTLSSILSGWRMNQSLLNT